MSNNLANLRHKIAGAEQLESVVRTMKAQAASNIGQYETAMLTLGDYYRTVELGLTACFRKITPIQNTIPSTNTTVIIFGSDQGLVGKFNEQLVEFVQEKLGTIAGEKTIFAVGERVYGRLLDAGFEVQKTFAVPSAIDFITPLIGEILSETASGKLSQMFIFHNRPESANMYEPEVQQLLPLDAAWQKSLAKNKWQTNNLPEIIGDNAGSPLAELIREYLFISIFKACAESLASENASRLAAMQRAEKNIDELLENLKQSSHNLRQSSIDEELFDVIAGYELSAKKK